jgi:hypothetical protein
MGDGPGKGGSGATGGREGGGLENELSGRESAELDPFGGGGTWFTVEDVSCGEGGIYVGGVGKDSRMRGTGGRLPGRVWVLTGTGIVADDDGGEQVVAGLLFSVVGNGSIGNCIRRKGTKEGWEKVQIRPSVCACTERLIRNIIATFALQMLVSTLRQSLSIRIQGPFRFVE